MVFDIQNINTTNQTPVRIFKNNNGIGQRWDWNNTTGEVKGLDNKCLDAGNNSLGQFIRINDCTGGNNQKWDFTENYGVQNRTSKLCVGLAQTTTNGGSFTVDTINGNNLYLVGCNRDNCTWSFQNSGVSGYNATAVGGDSCAVVPYVAPVTSPSNTTPSNSYNPGTTTSGNGGGYTPSAGQGGGSNTYNSPSVDSTISNDNDIYDDLEFQNFLNSEHDILIEENQTNIGTRISNSFWKGMDQLSELTYPIYYDSLCDYKNEFFNCTSAYLIAKSSSILLTCRLLWGMIKGIVGFALSFLDVVGLVGGLISAGNSLQTMLANVSKVMDQDFLKNLFVSAGNQSSSSVNMILDDWDSKDIWGKFEHIGYWIAYIGLSVWTIKVAIQSAIKSIPSMVSTVKSFVSSPLLFTKSLISGTVLKVGTLAINVKTFTNSVKITGYEIVRLVKAGKGVELSKFIFNKSIFEKFFAPDYNCVFYCEPVIFTDIQLQKKFKHAIDFGVQGNYTLANRDLFKTTIQNFVNNNTKLIGATYRGQAAEIYFNYQTGQFIALKNGGFWTGWKLSPSQFNNLKINNNI